MKGELGDVCGAAAKEMFLPLILIEAFALLFIFGDDFFLHVFEESGLLAFFDFPRESVEGVFDHKIQHPHPVFLLLLRAPLNLPTRFAVGLGGGTSVDPDVGSARVEDFVLEGRLIGKELGK